MWQKVAGIFTFGGKHHIWYIRVLRYAESKNQIGRQEEKPTGPFYFWGLFITYIMSHQILLFRVRIACLSIFMCIWITNVCNYITITHTDICVCINIHMHTRCVIGRSWVRVPPGVSYFPGNFDCFKKTFSWKWVLFPLHDWQFICCIYIYIYAFMLFSSSCYMAETIFTVMLP